MSNKKEQVVDLKKRNLIKKAAIGAAAVGVGLAALTPVANAGGIIFRSGGQEVSVANIASAGKSTLGMTIDNTPSAITTGNKGYITIPFACTITGWYLVADRSGSIVIDVWKKSAAIPSVTETITGTEKPTLASQQLNNLTTLTTWTSTTVAAGDVISYNVDSVSSVQRVTLTLVVTK